MTSAFIVVKQHKDYWTLDCWLNTSLCPPNGILNNGKLGGDGDEFNLKKQVTHLNHKIQGAHEDQTGEIKSSNCQVSLLLN